MMTVNGNLPNKNGVYTAENVEEITLKNATLKIRWVQLLSGVYLYGHDYQQSKPSFQGSAFPITMSSRAASVKACRAMVIHSAVPEECRESFIAKGLLDIQKVEFRKIPNPSVYVPVAYASTHSYRNFVFVAEECIESFCWGKYVFVCHKRKPTGEFTITEYSTGSNVMKDGTRKTPKAAIEDAKKHIVQATYGDVAFMEAVLEYARYVLSSQKLKRNTLLKVLGKI